MSSASTSPESWIGKLVWVFLRDDQGLNRIGEAKCGIVVDSYGVNICRVPMWIVQVGDNYHSVPVMDMELVEDWDEELEGEDCSLETSRERMWLEQFSVRLKVCSERRFNLESYREQVE